MTVGEMKIKTKSIQKLASIDMPITTAWKVQKNLSMIEPHYTIAENLRNELIRKHGKDDGTGNISVTDPEDQKLVLQELNNLDNTILEEEINFNKISLKELDGIKISPADLFILSDMITEE